MTSECPVPSANWHESLRILSPDPVRPGHMRPWPCTLWRLSCWRARCPLLLPRSKLLTLGPEFWQLWASSRVQNFAASAETSADALDLKSWDPGAVPDSPPRLRRPLGWGPQRRAPTGRPAKARSSGEFRLKKLWEGDSPPVFGVLPNLLWKHSEECPLETTKELSFGGELQLELAARQCCDPAGASLARQSGLAAPKLTEAPVLVQVAGLRPRPRPWTPRPWDTPELLWHPLKPASLLPGPELRRAGGGRWSRRAWILELDLWGQHVDQNEARWNGLHKSMSDPPAEPVPLSAPCHAGFLRDKHLVGTRAAPRCQALWGLRLLREGHLNDWEWSA